MACADTFYSLFPNIYTIRGEPSRDALAWSKTVRIVQSYGAEVLAPSHFHPIYGRDNINNVLEKLADAMQFVHDQTLRLMGKGYTPDTIGRMIDLPRSLAEEPNLIQVLDLARMSRIDLHRYIAQIRCV
jgi:alkyl sulfatase BDS1-like metallo-beta-lactamase superfamily hydrolase